MNVDASGSAASVLIDMYYNSPNPATLSTPLVAPNTFRPCSVRGCSRLLSDDSTNTICDPCHCGESAREKAVVVGGVEVVNNWLDLNSNTNLEDRTSDSVRESPSNQSATTVPKWTQSIDPWLFSTPVHLEASSIARATSELENPLAMPGTAQEVHGESPKSGLKRSPVEITQTDEERVEAEDSRGQMRVCSVRGCKQTVPVGYGYKMCPACRLRYQKYGTAKRAKRKVVRDKEKQAGCSVSEDSDEDTPPAQRPPTPPSIQPEPLPHMHQPTVSFIQEQVPRPSSTPSASAMGYLESDPIVNGFSKFRVELFEGELNGRHTEGTVMSAPDVMMLGASSNAGQRIATDPQAPSSVSFGRTALTLSGEHPVKNASDVDSSKERPSATSCMTRPIVPVSLSVCDPATSDAERHVAPGQNNIQSQDGPSSPPLPTTAAKPKGKRKAAKGASTTLSTSRASKPSSSLPHANTAAPPQGYPTPHPYLYPYYPMYFPPYPGAYQYPYLPMPFAAPPSSMSKTKKKKKPAQIADVMSTPLPPPPFTYPYPPGHSGVWTYPTQPHFPTPPPPPAPPQIPNSLSQGSTSVSPVDPAPPPSPPSPPPPPSASALYTTPSPYSLPAFHQPPQGPSVSTPPVAQCPRVSGTQPYSGTPLTTLMPVPFFSVGTSATVPSAGGSRQDKGKGAEKGGTRGEIGRESYHQIHVQKPPHVQMQFNYYHYGMGTSQSPTTPEANARRKRRKVDPQYREKLELFRAQAKAPANPDSASSSVPVPFAQGESQPDLNAPVPSAFTEKEGTGDDDAEGNLDEEPTLVRHCSNKGCMRALPLDRKNRSTICKKCKMKFKKRTERTKERFRLVPKKTVCARLGKLST